MHEVQPSNLVVQVKQANELKSVMVRRVDAQVWREIRVEAIRLDLELGQMLTLIWRGYQATVRRDSDERR